MFRGANPSGRRVRRLFREKALGIDGKNKKETDREVEDKGGLLSRGDFSFVGRNRK